jgi:hypothetical protein
LQRLSQSLKQILHENGNFVDLMSCLTVQDSKLLLQIYELVDLPSQLSIPEYVNISSYFIEYFYVIIMSEIGKFV